MKLLDLVNKNDYRRIPMGTPCLFNHKGTYYVGTPVDKGYARYPYQGRLSGHKKEGSRGYKVLVGDMKDPNNYRVFLPQEYVTFWEQADLQLTQLQKAYMQVATPFNEVIRIFADMAGIKKPPLFPEGLLSWDSVSSKNVTLKDVCDQRLVSTTLPNWACAYFSNEAAPLTWSLSFLPHRSTRRTVLEDLLHKVEPDHPVGFQFTQKDLEKMCELLRTAEGRAVVKACDALETDNARLIKYIKGNCS